MQTVAFIILINSGELNESFTSLFFVCGDNSSKLVWLKLGNDSSLRNVSSKFQCFSENLRSTFLLDLLFANSALRGLIYATTVAHKIVNSMLKYFEFQETLENLCQDILLTSSVQYPALTSNYTLLKDFLRKHIYNTHECFEHEFLFPEMSALKFDF